MQSIPVAKPYVDPDLLTPTPEGLPTIYYVETVLACNLACPECVIGMDSVERTKKIMKMDEFEIISEKIAPYAKHVYLHKWGEPLMNKNIVKMITLVSKYAHPHLSTNGILIDQKKAEQIITSGLGTMIISIDGMSQEIYEKYRVKGKVDKVIENIKMLNEINKLYGKPVDILPQMIAFKHNYSEIEEFKKFCENLDLKPIIKKPYIRFGSVEESGDPKYERIKYDSKDLHLEAISKCSFATNILTITADGKILLCHQDYNGDWEFGNILDENTTVKKIWEGRLFQGMRNGISNKKPPKLCTNNCMIYNPGYMD